MSQGVESPVLGLLEASSESPGSGHLLSSGLIFAVVDRDLLWWQAPDEGGTVAVVTAAGEVHLLAGAQRSNVASEPLSNGDRVIVLNSALRSALPDLEGALEMALVDDPSPSASCLWLIDAADDTPSPETFAVAVVRNAASA